MLRNPRGVAVSLVTTWFNIPIALLGAAAGVFYGGIVGVVGGSALAGKIPGLGEIVSAVPVFVLLNSAGPIIGGIAGAIFGAVLGAFTGLFGPWLLQFSESPALAIVALIGQMLLGFVSGILYTLYQVKFEAFLLRLKGARRMSRREYALIMPIARQCAESLRILGLPRILVTDKDEVNAFAGARHIVLHQGLLDEFDYDPEVLAGVISHELTHWNHADAVAAAFVRGVALPLYLVYIAAMAIVRRLGSHPVIKFIIWYFGWSFLVAVRYIIMPAQAADARASEYRADGGAREAGHLAGMRTCLTRLKATVDGGRSGWDETICGLHPPNELRLERLELSGTAYPLPDPEAPPKPFPVTVVK